MDVPRVFRSHAPFGRAIEIRLLGLWSYIGEVRSTAEGDSGWILFPESIRSIDSGHVLLLYEFVRRPPLRPLLSNRGSWRSLCLCSHTTHNAAAATALACFLPTLHTLFSDRAGTFDGFPLLLPWPAGLPSFARIGQRLLSMLRLGISSASPCSARPCCPASPAAAARDFNTEFSPATFPGRLRSCGLVGQSEFWSGADWIFRAVSCCLTT